MTRHPRTPQFRPAKARVLPRWRRHVVARAVEMSCGWAAMAGLGALALSPMALAQTSGAGGTLPVATVPVLRGVVGGQVVVNAPVAGAAVPRMTIDQASQRAILDWRSFNIGRDAEVVFQHQMGSIASTLNRIYDADPSVIQGRLSSVGPIVNGRATAGGQVILINQNGILFDRGSQVNTQSLLASTLNLSMSNQQFCGGDLASCKSGAALTAGGLLSAAFQGGYDAQGNPLPTRPDGQRPGNIGIGSFGPAGAAAPVIQSGAEGSVILLASRIDNDGGKISSPDGQVVLAAGSKVYLAVNEDAADITLRGLVVEVDAHKLGSDLNLTNQVRNAGEVSAARGNVTLAALAINQEGRVSASTAVQRNGSIFLKARSKDNADAGTLRLAAGSVTEVMPDAADTATLPDSTDYAPYRGIIRAQAGVIDSAGTLQAAGGRIGLEASNAADPTAARVYLGDGSVTSVAGAWADVDVAKNLATFRVTSNELKNAPDQKNGILLGATVTVDLREGNNILALDGYRGAVARTVLEKAAAGGELSIGSTGAVIQRNQAVIDATGGGYRYGAGTVRTSSLLGDDGRIYDITTAPQQRPYVAQLDRYTSAASKWDNQGQTYETQVGSTSSLREAYVEGKAGGSVRVGSGAGLVLDGILRGGVTIGTRQLAQAPRGASLAIGSGFDLLRLNTVDDRIQVVYNDESQRIGHVVWRQQAADSLGSSFKVDSALTTAQRDTILLGADQVFAAAGTAGGLRVEQGFGSVTVNSEGRITVPANVRIQSGLAGSLTLRAPALDIAGDIRLPSGALTLDPISGNVSGVRDLDFVDASLASLSERTIVRTGATLSVAGDWINLSGAADSASTAWWPLGRQLGTAVQSALAGGTLTISPRADLAQIRLERGSVLDVSGGAQLGANRRLSGGRGGTLVINNGLTGQTSSDWLQSDLLGYGLSAGGTLRLGLNDAVIDTPQTVGTLPSSTTRLRTDLFTGRGFASFTINAAQGIELSDNTPLLLRQLNLLVDTAAALQLRSGSALSSVAEPALLPDHLRAPASLTLAAGQTLRVGTGALIRTDPGATVNLTAGSENSAPPAAVSLVIDGQVIAPGGRITATLRGAAQMDAAPLRLGSAALLSTAGTFVATPSDTGLTRGTVYGGGTVTLDAAAAGVETAAGSRIDVSGIEKTVDLPSADGGVDLQVMAGHAGTLIIKSQSHLVLGGSLAANGPGSAAGGSLAVELTRAERQTALPPEQRLVVSATGADQTPGRSGSNSTTSVLDAGLLTSAGFEKLRLLSEDSIEFQGNVNLAFQRGLRLDAPQLRLGSGAQVSLSGATVSLGQSLGAREQVSDTLDATRTIWSRNSAKPLVAPALEAGTGVLRIDGGSVDFYGSMALQGAALTRVHSDSDVRFIGKETNFNTGGSNDASLKYQYGSLRSAGNLEFDATQLYPATRTRFDVQTTGGTSYLLVSSNGQKPTDVYAVAGSLTLKAATIVQGGVVRAPQGEISLQASNYLELSSGSLTSVSGAGLDVLYGTTLSGLQWRYIDGPQSTSVTNPLLLESVSDKGKRLTLSATNVAVQAGATLDMSGGGNVLAVEFVPGNGGDTDIATAADTFAIVPKSQLAGIPYDTYLQLAGLADPGSGFSLSNPRDAALYDSIRIDSGARVPAGDYVLLPTRFALLPDAYLVQLQTGSAFRSLQPGQSTTLANGERVVAGHRSARGTSVVESQSVGVVVLPGTAVSRYSDYTRSGAELLASEAARVDRLLVASPWDAGAMTIRDATSLSLGGEFLTVGASQGVYSGRSSEVDLVGNRVAIVKDVGSQVHPAGTLEISSRSLTALKSSVLVGGTRQRTADGVQITTLASTVTVANDASSPVDLPELLISATQSIDVASGSVLKASGAGATGGTGPVLHTETTGALLRLSNGQQASVDRGTAATTQGDLNVASGASLQASGALLLDATRSTRSAGQLSAGGANGSGGSVSLAASSITLGETASAAPGSLAGLVLSNSDLAAYAQLDNLTLRAYGVIELMGTTTLGGNAAAQLTLDTPSLVSRPVNGSTQAQIHADQVSWLNRSTTQAASSGGSGSLDIQATQITLGAGDKSTQGFGTVTLTALSEVGLEGSGSLRSGGNLNLFTPALQAGAGSNQRVAAVSSSAGGTVTSFGALQLQGLPAGSTALAPSSNQGLGGRVLLQGASVGIDTAVNARSGSISLQAQGGDITLGGRATLDASGSTRDFSGSVAAADGGQVSMSAEGAQVRMTAGSRLDVAAADEGGNAGSWVLRAQGADLQGTVSGNAAAGARTGSADIDLGVINSLAAVNAALDAGGFTEERRIRARSGDMAVRSGESVQARRVALVADTGRIDIEGTVGQNTGAGGGRIELSAATGLRLAAGSRLLAAGADVAARGGDVRAETRGGTLAFEQGAQIDVRAGDAGPAGSVVFGVLRSVSGTTNTVGSNNLRGEVLRYSPSGLLAAAQGSAGDRAASVDLEATRVYSGSAVPASIGSTQLTAWANDHQSFVNSVANSTLAANMHDERGALTGAGVLGATEIQSAGSLSLDANWDLTSTAWRAGGKAGTLTLRAAGDVNLRQTLGAPNLATNGTNQTTNNANANTNHAVLAGETWNIRVAAGADLASANALSTRGTTGGTANNATGSGNLLLNGASAGIRTGTGNIELAAAGDIRIDNVAAAIYTAGRMGAADSAVNGNNRWTVDGGSIRLRAGGSVQGPAGAADLWVTDWLRRYRETPSNFVASNYATDWWVYRPRFQQGVATLGGGDVEVLAGGSVNDLLFAAPTAGRTSTVGSARMVEVTGGGKLSVTAGGDINGASFLIGRGTGSVQAGGDLGRSSAIQTYLMGASSGITPERAELSLSAGGAAFLQSSDNPTYMGLNPGAGAAGPSFHPTNPGSASPSSVATTFFTYAPNSGLSISAEGGDLKVRGSMAAASAWRSVSAPAVTAQNISPDAAFPPRLSLVAFDGAIIGPAEFVNDANIIKTYPSALASVSLLASGDIRGFALEVSDLAPSALVTPTTNYQDARPDAGAGSTFFHTGKVVTTSLKPIRLGRITQRGDAPLFGLVSRSDEAQGLYFDVQAGGDIRTTKNEQWVLPARSRMQAAGSIIDPDLRLQNLDSSDVSEVRAVSGDVIKRNTSGGIEIGGPGQLWLQAGGDVDLGGANVALNGTVVGGLVATGDTRNPLLGSSKSARISVLAGVSGTLDRTLLDSTYARLLEINRFNAEISAVYAQLGVELETAGGRDAILAAAQLSALVARNPAFERLLKPRSGTVTTADQVAYDRAAAEALATYKRVLNSNLLPLASTSLAQATRLLSLLAREDNVQRLSVAVDLASLLQPGSGTVTLGGEVLDSASVSAFKALGDQYPLLFQGAVQRRVNGARLTGVVPLVFDELLRGAVKGFIDQPSSGGGNIYSYRTSVQTLGGSDIDLWAPAGDIVVGLTTPSSGQPVGIVTNQGGAIRSMLSGNFNINQGKVLTAQGGDILIYSAQGSIDAGRGAKTSLSTPTPQRRPILDAAGNQIGVEVVIPASATGSGIQTLTSDPDGLGPVAAPDAGDIYLFAPAGKIDAGEAGIRSSGNILINAQVVLNASDIKAAGASQGVPQVPTGSVAATLAASNQSPSSAAQADDKAAKAAEQASRQAAQASKAPKPTVLSVEVLGFGDKNCKEDDKECFAK